ncbi:DUF2202 domain-containing protein [Sulfurovum riftiae]|nr:DUF2202 domain-containing protein [Sulfurovum riftiae]
MKKYMLGSAVAASFLLMGCGSSDGTTDTISSATTGYVVDSRVQNMNYDCVADGVENRTTGPDGAFTCQNMSQVRFRLGGLVLGEIHTLPQDGYVFPQDIAGVDRSDLENETVMAMAQLIQSLDEDHNLDNGIRIPQEVETQFEAENFNAADLDTYMDQASVAPEHVQTRTGARQHLRDTMQEFHVTINNSGVDLNSYAMSTLTPELKETIIYMGNEERLAYDVYMNLYNFHIDNGEEIKQLFNIADKAETKHIEIVQSLVHRYELDASTIIADPVADSSVTLADMPSGKYGIPAIQALYDTLYAKGIISKQDALEAGCMVEVVDINDLNADIELAIEADAEDIVAAYNVLRDGSYNHYWAFDKGLKNMGVTDGCCALGNDYCHPEYPQKENDKGKQH